MQTQEPLMIRPAKAPAPVAGPRERTEQADKPASFLTSLDKARERAAGAEETARSGEESPAIQEGVANPNQEAQALDAQATVPQGEAKEGLLPEVWIEQEQPGEDVPVENGAEMAILAALMQSVAPDPAVLPMEMEQGAENQVGQEPILAAEQAFYGQIPQEQAVQEQAAQGQAAQWQAHQAQAFEGQAADPLEGERELPRMEEPMAQAVSAATEQENTLPGEPSHRPAAMRAGEAGGSRENDMNRSQAMPRQETAAFGPGPIGTHPALDLSAPEGEALPAPQAGPILADGLFEQIQSAVSTGKQELFVQLKPESLGGLAIHLSMTEEGIKAQVRTSSESVGHLVNAQLAQLEESLRARDIPVVQMEVIYDQTAGNSFLGQQRQAFGESGGWTRGHHPGFGAEEPVSLYEAALVDTPAQELGEGGVEYSA